MAEIDLVAKDVIESLIKQKFEAPLPKNQDDDDPFIKGEFDVIKELLEKVVIICDIAEFIDPISSNSIEAF